MLGTPSVVEMIISETALATCRVAERERRRRVRLRSVLLFLFLGRQG